MHDSASPDTAPTRVDRASDALFRASLVFGTGAFVVFTVYVAEYTTWGRSVPEMFGIDGALGTHPEYVGLALLGLCTACFVASLYLTLAAADG